MSFVRGLVLPALAGLILSAAPAQAGELDSCRLQTRAGGLRVASADLHSSAQTSTQQAAKGYAFEALEDEINLGLHSTYELDRVPMADLRQIEDFHPETDRWTEHNNRIRITWWNGGWFFSKDLDIEHTWATGLRLAWEVPGFIGIRLDHGIAPLANLEVRSGVNGRDTIRGFVHSHTLSLAIFNPELSVDGLAFWAGFGAGLWVYDFQENNVNTGNIDFSDTNLSGNIFIEIDYKIADIFHVGIGIRQHFLLADQTDDSRYYVAGSTGVGTDGRNNGILDDLAGVTELTFNLSVLF